MSKPKSAPICPYCGAAAELVGGDVIYPHRPDLSDKRFWRCAPCDAWVGTHAGSKRAVPLGRLATEDLRRAKGKAHAAFDRLWKAKQQRDGCSMDAARGSAYAWLSEQMDIPFAETHIGMFDVAQCERVVELCRPYMRGAA